MPSPNSIIEIATPISFGILAGIYFIFSNTIMGALAKKPYKQAARMMTQININILNPFFFILFWGSGICAIYIIYNFNINEYSITQFVGAMVFLLGSILITLFKNVPLNNQLARVVTNRYELENTWSLYLVKWTRWNHLRTILATSGFVLILL